MTGSLCGTLNVTTTTAFRSGSGFRLRRRVPTAPPGRLHAHAAIAGLSFIAYILARLVEGPAGTALAAFGVSACGWAWLLTRALFDPAPQDAVWPRAAVAVLTVSGAAGVLAPEGGALTTVANNLYVLSGSAALVMTVVEPFQRHGGVLTRSERRFRATFAVVFVLLVGVSVLVGWTSPEPVQMTCAMVSLLGAAVAVVYRLRHPLVPASRDSLESKPATVEETALAQRMERLVREEAIHLDPDLRIGEIAARLGAPEHRISRCIGAALGFANFNRWINHHRIEAAKRRLEAGDDHAILLIALDSGFASVGPFNRAFKAETGMTPRAYRALWRS